MLIKVQLQVCEDGNPCWEIQLQCQKNEQNSWEENQSDIKRVVISSNIVSIHRQILVLLDCLL